MNIKILGEHKDGERNGQRTQTLTDEEKEAFPASESAY